MIMATEKADKNFVSQDENELMTLALNKLKQAGLDSEVVSSVPYSHPTNLKTIFINK